jgi:hypothetical protein
MLFPFLLAALLAGAAPAGAATFPAGEVTLKFAPAFRKAADLRLTGGMDGTFSNRSGTATMKTDNTGTASLTSLTGTAQTRTLWRFASGSRVIRFRDTQITIRRGQASLEPGVLEQDGRRVKLFETTGKSRIKASPGFATLVAKSAPIVLTSAGAQAFNAALKTKAFTKGMKAGTLSFTLERQLWATSGGRVTLIFDPAFKGSLESCDGLMPRLNSATEIPEGPDAPNGGIAIGVVQNPVFTPRDGALSILVAGGLDLIKAGDDFRLHTVSLSGFTVTRTGLVRVTTAGSQTIADLTGGTFKATVTATGGSVSLTGATAAVSAALSQQFERETRCPLPAGTRIGVVNASTPVA